MVSLLKTVVIVAVVGFSLAPARAWAVSMSPSTPIAMRRPQEWVGWRATFHSIAVATTHSADRTRATVGYILIGLVVASWIVFFIVRARRRRPPRAYPPFPPVPEGVTATPPPPAPLRDLGRPPDVGWHPDPDHMSEQLYWDGQSWTARRRWNGESWIDVSQGRG